MTRMMGGLRTYQKELPNADMVRDRAMSVYARSRRTELQNASREGHQRKSWAEVTGAEPRAEHAGSKTRSETQAPAEPSYQSATYASMGGTHVPDDMADAGPTHDQIAQRAYEIHLERGGEPGDPEEDWFRAERELREAHRRT